MLLTAITFILILGLLIFIHELGHFTAAKVMGIKVLEFGFGLPPRLFGRKYGETEYTINALPIMIGALCVLAIGYRYYSAFIAAKVLAFDDTRVTPAHRLADGHGAGDPRMGGADPAGDPALRQ